MRTKINTNKTTQEFEAEVEKCKQRYFCTAGKDGGWCDGTKVGSRMRCPFVIVTAGDEQNACELEL